MGFPPPEAIHNSAFIPDILRCRSVYRIAGKFGGELNLAVWRSAFATTKLKSTNISYVYSRGNPVLNHQI